MKATIQLDTFNEALYADKIRRELTSYEPKRIHRFLVEFPNLEYFITQRISKPKFINGKWGDIEIEFIDLVGPSTSQTLFAFTNAKEYPIVFDKRSFIDKILGKPMFDFKIKGIDPTGVVIENWTIDVKKIKSIDFGEYDYGNDGISFVHLTLQPKNCILNY